MTESVPNRLYVTRDDIAAFDKRMGLPGLGMRYVDAGFFVLKESENMNKDVIVERVPA